MALSDIALCTVDEYKVYKGQTRAYSATETARVEMFISNVSRQIEAYLDRPLLDTSTITEPTGDYADQYASYGEIGDIPEDIVMATFIWVDWNMFLATNLGTDSWSDTDKSKSLNLSMPETIKTLIEPYKYHGAAADLFPFPLPYGRTTGYFGL